MSDDLGIPVSDFDAVLSAVPPEVAIDRVTEGFVRFALIENPHRINQAVRGIKKVLAAGPVRVGS